jgi:hypothetical protein
LVSQSPPWWVHWQQKAHSLKFESKTQWGTARRPKSWRKAQEGHLEEVKPQKPANGKNSGKVKQHDKEELRKAQNKKKATKKSSKLKNSKLPLKSNSS